MSDMLTTLPWGHLLLQGPTSVCLPGLWGQRYTTTELLVNNNPIGAIFLNLENVIDGIVTFVVLVNQGDDVFVKTTSR